MKGYKRCKCKDDTGREVGASCPRLHRPDGSWNPAHGTWYGKKELPPGPGGIRVSLRQGGFPTQERMSAWFDEAQALIDVAGKHPEDHPARMEIVALIKESRRNRVPLPSRDDIARRFAAGGTFRPGTTGDYLITWLARHMKRWAPTTGHGYERAVHRLFLPAFGEIPLDRLRRSHVLAVLDSLDAEAERIRAAKASQDPQVRRSVAGLRPPGAATKRRYLAVLRSALADAQKEGLVTLNVAANVSVGTDRGRARLWTPERERAWRELYDAEVEARGEMTRAQRFAIWHRLSSRPAPVMVWTPAHLGQFLDAVESDRLYALFCIIGHCGLRRGEACGLPWREVDLENGVATINSQIVQVGWKAVAAPPKTDASIASVRLDSVTVQALRAWRRQQLAERIAWGPAWQDTGLVFTREDGSAYHPSYLTTRFERLAFEAGLPPIRLHDLRHGTATLALAGGAEMKTVSSLLRHSSTQITENLYTEVLPELAAQVAEKVAAMVPRKRGAR